MATPPQTAGSIATPKRPSFVLWIVSIAILVLFFIIVLGPSGGLARVLALLGNVQPVAYWIIIMLVMIVLFGLIGHATNGRWAGALIDSSTKSMSLSRLQVALWTILVLSAYLMLAMPRIFGQMTPVGKLDPNDSLLQQCLNGKGNGFNPTIESCGGGALQITFPSQLILAMGISLASFAGSHLIQSVKSNQVLNLTERENKVTAAEAKLAKAQEANATQQAASDKLATALADAKEAYDLADAKAKNPQPGENPDDLKNQQGIAKRTLDESMIRYQRSINDLTQTLADVNAAQQALDVVKKDEQVARTEADGLLHKNDDVSQASWIDIFRGNLISNYMQVDFGKVQMFFFTVVVVVAYGAAVAALLGTRTALLNPLGVGLPPFSDSLNGLLAISHGTYLTTKATAQS